MLQLTGLAGAMGLAGCLGADSGGGDQSGVLQDYEGETTSDVGGSSLDHVDGQEFRVPTTTAIEDFHWFHPDETGFREWELFTYEHGAWGPWSIVDYLAIGDLHPLQFEEIDYSEDRIDITVRDDAYWSDEEPVTGRDAIFQPIIERIRTGRRSFDRVQETEATLPPEAISDFEYDGRSATLYSEGGHFGDFPEQTVWQSMFVEYGPRIPTHVDEIGEYADEVYDVMEAAVDGDAAPWEEGSGISASDLEEEVFGSDTDYLQEKYRDPSNVVVNGAWTLEEVRGDAEVWLKPNPHHRSNDLINFDRIVMEFVDEGNAIWAGIQNMRFDMSETEPDEQTASSFPDEQFMHLVPDNNGMAIVCNGKSEMATSHPRVRQAICAALDFEEISDAMNPDTWEGINTPGADNPATPEFLDDEFYEDTLMTYGHDLDLATDLMEEAGYERDENETWVDDNGDAANFSIATNSANAELEQYIAGDLEEFGFNAEYQTFEPTIMEDNQDSGNLAAWTGNQNAGFAPTAATPFEYAVFHENHIRRYGWFEGDNEENIKQTPFDDDGFPESDDPESFEHLTVRAPPVGDFWADESEWEEWPAVSMSYRLQVADEEELEELYPQLLWLSNWFLAGIPIANRYKQFWLNTENWYWPMDLDEYSEMEYVNTSTRLTHQDLHARGDRIFADPENPKD